MTLDKGKINHSYRVVAIELDDKITKHLQAIGMTNNVVVTVLNNKHQGTIIIKVRQVRYALGMHISKKIEVEPCLEA
ncbi:MAG: FeoA domain-containing protein [Erysipelotrichaceae bacterium]|nr:FeoA domain-containing protein [Erysipelotrichaceae bacterium]MDY5252095.1 FeoA domain-containing protein [Erysipelotrichaceae bacterium]